MPSQRPTIPQPTTAIADSLETTILVARAAGLAGWDARGALAEAVRAAASQPRASAMRLAA
ncbi:hypothetical protein MMR14E_10735 [Methylobacterium mesophilicum]